MVFPGEEEEYMATGHERAKKSRHNFSFPNLKWGTQRNLRCMKVESDGGGDQRLRRRSSPSKLDGTTRFVVDTRSRRSETGRWRSAEKTSEEGIEELGVKIISDLRTAKESFLRKRLLDYNEEEEEEEPRKKEREMEVSPPEAPGVTAEVKPWNLRKRRAAACKAPVAESEDNQYNERGLGVGEERGAYPSMKPRFLSTVSKTEVEDDYMKMMGHRPPRRPKKRPRTVQKQIDLLHPALYFAERITEDIYKIPDEAENVKR